MALRGSTEKGKYFGWGRGGGGGTFPLNWITRPLKESDSFAAPGPGGAPSQGGGSMPGGPSRARDQGAVSVCACAGACVS